MEQNFAKLLRKSQFAKFQRAIPQVYRAGTYPAFSPSNASTHWSGEGGTAIGSQSITSRNSRKNALSTMPAYTFALKRDLPPTLWTRPLRYVTVSNLDGDFGQTELANARAKYELYEVLTLLHQMAGKPAAASVDREKCENASRSVSTSASSMSLSMSLSTPLSTSTSTPSSASTTHSSTTHSSTTHSSITRSSTTHSSKVLTEKTARDRGNGKKGENLRILYDDQRGYPHTLFHPAKDLCQPGGACDKRPRIPGRILNKTPDGYAIGIGGVVALLPDHELLPPDHQKWSAPQSTASFTLADIYSKRAFYFYIKQASIDANGRPHIILSLRE